MIPMRSGRRRNTPRRPVEQRADGAQPGGLPHRGAGAHAAQPVGSVSGSVLLAFGIALTTETAEGAPANRTDLAIVVLLKTILMPAGAFALARWGFDAPPAEVLVVTVIAAIVAVRRSRRAISTSI